MIWKRWKEIISSIKALIVILKGNYQRIAVRLYITLRPPLHRFKLKYQRSRPWLAGLILVAILSSCGTIWVITSIGGSYYQDESSAEIVAKVLEYLRRTGVIKDVDPTLPLFEPAPCMFGGSETWRYYGSPEEAGYICGYVEAPLFHEFPDSEKIKIPVAILPSDYPIPELDPLFLAQGGPGGASLDLFPSLALNFFTLPRNRDLVMVDQRGTRYADPLLQCLAEDFPEPEDESESADDAAYVKGLKTCYQRLTAEVGDLSAFTTPQMAGDIDSVRRALGYEQINFYGVSYGTHIGQYLMALYPESIRSVILDGVAPIPFDYINRMLFTHDRVLEELFANCERDPVCSASYPDLEHRMQALLKELDQHPIRLKFHDPNSFASFEDELDGYDFVNMMMGLFYYDRSYALLPYLIQQAEQGNFMYFELIGDYTYFDWSFSNEVYLTVLCSEHEEFGIDRKITNEARAWLLDYEQEDWLWYDDACGAWNVRSPDSRLEMIIESDIPVLLLSGQFDPVTPPEYAEETRRLLLNSYHIVDPKGSHGIAFSDECTEKIFNDFTDHPEEEPDYRCLSEDARHVDVVPPDSIQLKILMNDSTPLAFLNGFKWVFGILSIFIMLDSIENLSSGLWDLAFGKRKVAIRQEFSIRKLHRIFIFIFALSAFIYCVYMADTIMVAQANRNYSDAFAIPGEPHSFLAFPGIMLILGFEVFVTGLSLWRQGVLIKKQKNYFRLFSFLSCSFLVFLIWQGLVMLPI